MTEAERVEKEQKVVTPVHCSGDTGPGMLTHINAGAHTPGWTHRLFQLINIRFHII